MSRLLSLDRRYKLVFGLSLLFSFPCLFFSCSYEDKVLKEIQAPPVPKKNYINGKYVNRYHAYLLDIPYYRWKYVKADPLDLLFITKGSSAQIFSVAISPKLKKSKDIFIEVTDKLKGKKQKLSSWSQLDLNMSISPSLQRFRRIDGSFLIPMRSFGRFDIQRKAILLCYHSKKNLYVLGYMASPEDFGDHFQEFLDWAESLRLLRE